MDSDTLVAKWPLRGARIVAVFNHDGGALVESGLELGISEGREIRSFGQDDPFDRLEYQFAFSILDAPIADAGEAAEASIVIEGTHEGRNLEIRGQGWVGYDDHVQGQRHQEFGEQVDVRLFTGDDRIRMPRTMLPPIRGGDDGWFKLKNVEADARSIRASASVNFMNNPKVFIDRVTGTISISGKAGDYTGQCEAVDTNAAPKF